MAVKNNGEFCECELIHEDTVREVASKMLGDKEYDDLSMLMKMFADPSRLRILHALEKSEMCVCDLAALLGLTKSAVSHQLKGLRISGLVKNRREGQIVFYSLADDHVSAIIDTGLEHLNE